MARPVFSPEISMHAQKSDRPVPAALIALSLVPAIGGTVRLTRLASGADVTPENARVESWPAIIRRRSAPRSVLAPLLRGRPTTRVTSNVRR